MRHITTLFLLSGFVVMAKAQTSSLFATNMYYDGSSRYNDSHVTGKQVVDKLNYSEIKGTCFWRNDWNEAILVPKKGSAIKLKQVKLSFYSNEVLFIDKSGTPLVADIDIAKVIFIDPSDSAKVAAVFFNFSGPEFDNKKTFGQILNDGRFQLIKTSPTTTTTTRDPFSHENEFTFQTINHYFILSDGVIHPLAGRGVNKESVFAIVEPSDRETAWLKANNNKLKNEKQAIEFLTFCGTK